MYLKVFVFVIDKIAFGTKSDLLLRKLLLKKFFSWAKCRLKKMEIVSECFLNKEENPLKMEFFHVVNV